MLVQPVTCGRMRQGLPRCKGAWAGVSAPPCPRGRTRGLAGSDAAVGQREAAHSHAAGVLSALEEEYRAVDIRAGLTSEHGAERGLGDLVSDLGKKTSLQHTWYSLSGEIFTCQDTAPDSYDPSSEQRLWKGLHPHYPRQQVSSPEQSLVTLVKDVGKAS